ncbi:MAG: TIGR03862 family flavoprotein [Cellulomonas sp.]|nr:TIGR03862 family flavoprotein [Cellulomonas sp.]
MSTASVIGGGPAGLIAAEELARAGVAVTVHEHMPAVGRKFLLAGHGGLNITHSEDRDRLLARYGESADRIAPMLAVFGPQDLRDWCAGLGEPTFVGSSGRVFPRAFRATPLLRAWLARLAELGVRIETRQRWTGWTDQPGELRFTRDDAGSVEVEVEVTSDVAIFALGGASWPRLGSDGGWVGPFGDRAVAVSPLRPANVGVRVEWTSIFAERFEGAPLKNVGLTVRGQTGQLGRTVHGDAMVTRTGLEGGPI